MRRVLVVGALLAAVLPLAAVPQADAAPRHRERVVPCSRGLVALTFDDGPSVTVTPRLVRLLQRERVPATFFMIGQHVDAHPEVARMVARAGFAIGNHTWAHEDLTTRTPKQIRTSIRATHQALLRAGIAPTSFARPPYGAMDDQVRRVLVGIGYTPVLWTIDPRDWAGASTPLIETRVLGAVRRHRTNVVLQHDGVTNSPATLRAMSTEIRTLRRRGFCFAGLDAAGQPTPPVPVASVRPDERRVAEGGRVGLTVRLDRPTSRPTTVRLTAEGRLSTDVVRFRVGETSARVSLRLPQDDADLHAARSSVGVSGGTGIQPSAPVRLHVVDDDPAPVVSLGDAEVDASPLLPTQVDVPVRLDRTTDHDVEVVGHSSLGRVETVVPAGSQEAVLVFTVPVGTPRDEVQEVRVRVPGAAPATVVVRPPAQTRAEAVRSALATVRWPVVTLPSLF
ncbi:polysaccharide deacetylase family protein [Nocardioides conyzicola]